MTETWALAALWIGLALFAALASIWLRVATALSEIVIGTLAQFVIGGLFGAAVLGADQPWIKFLAGAAAASPCCRTCSPPRRCSSASTPSFRP